MKSCLRFPLFCIFSLAAAACSAGSSSEPAEPTAEELQSIEFGRSAQVSNDEVFALATEVAALYDSRLQIAKPSDVPAQRLAKLTKKHLREDGLTLNFKVYVAPEANIISFADGSIRVTAGLMERMKDDELLGLVGHEIGHIKLGHSAKQMRIAHSTAGLQKLPPGSNAMVGVVSQNEVTALAETIATTAYAPGQEKEADSYGLQFLARHKYDPRGAAKALNKLAALERDQVARYLQVHPELEARHERLAAEIDQLKRDIPQAEVSKDDPVSGTVVRTATLSRNTAAAPAPTPVESDQDIAGRILSTTESRLEAPPQESPKSAEKAPAEEPLAAGWYVQISAETEHDAAAEILRNLRTVGYTGQLQRAIVRDVRYVRVVIGPFTSREEAFEAKAQVRGHKLGNGEPFVKEVK